MGDDGLVGGAAAGAAGLQQRGVEPAAVLVGALEVDATPARCRPGGRAARRRGCEPESNQTSRMSVTFSQSSCGWSFARNRALAPSSNQASAPSVSKASRMRALTAGSRRISAVPSGWRLTKQVERHAPGALARQHPVGAGLHHRVEAVAAGDRDPFDEGVDRGQRPLADGAAVGVHAVVERLVDGDEPLRRVAVDHRRLGAPGVRVAVGHPPAGEERAGLDQLVDDGLVGLALLALGVEDLQAGEEGHVLGEGRSPRARCGSSGRRGRS